MSLVGMALFPGVLSKYWMFSGTVRRSDALRSLARAGRFTVTRFVGVLERSVVRGMQAIRTKVVVNVPLRLRSGSRVGIDFAGTYD